MDNGEQRKDVSDSIVDRIHETRHRIVAYFGNDFVRMARFGAGELDLPPDFFASSRKEPQRAPAMANVMTDNIITDDQLRADGFTVLVKALGDVNAERFIMLMNREPFDYTEWRKDNLFVGETVDSLMDKAESMYGDVYAEKQSAMNY